MHPYHRALLLSRPGVTPQDVEEFENLMSEIEMHVRIPPRTEVAKHRAEERDRRFQELAAKINPGDDTGQFLN
jgi:hypothetical protein